MFPGESGIDQLVEIIKVLGTPSREQIKTMNPNVSSVGGRSNANVSSRLLLVHGTQVPANQASSFQQGVPTANSPGCDRIDYQPVGVHPYSPTNVCLSNAFDGQYLFLSSASCLSELRRLYVTSSSTNCELKVHDCQTESPCRSSSTLLAKVS